MKKILFFASISSLLFLSFILANQSFSKDNHITHDRYAVIYPDYNGVTIPPNIAPLNFQIQENGEKFRVVCGAGENQIKVENRDGCISFPMKDWKRLLDKNRGGEFIFEISVNKDGQWHTFKKLVNRIAQQEIDSHLTYRLLNSAYSRWREMGIYQRNLETFHERPIINNNATEGKCMNCHSFNKNDPTTIMMHLRGGASSGTLIMKDGKLRKVNTATDFNKAGAYPAWHPSGELIAYSVNKLEMFFHARGQEPRDVLDRGSDLILYYVDENLVTTSPLVASVDRMETFPTWSPDGEYLYFVSCPDFATFIEGDDFEYEKMLYDLYRIPFNAETRTWGELELVLSGQEMGKSITQPRISPDGKYLLFTMADDGHFPIYKPSSDLYLMNLESGTVEPLPINSDQGETYHSWSSDGRWFVFSSKRMDGLLARPHFAYFAQDGTIHKPFVLPQKDPTFYQSYLQTYNRPELITGPVTVRPQVFVKTAYDNEHRFDANLDPQVRVRDQQVGGEHMYNVAPN